MNHSSRFMLLAFLFVASGIWGCGDEKGHDDGVPTPSGETPHEKTCPLTEDMCSAEHKTLDAQRCTCVAASAPTCGDGEIEGNEQCDGDNLDGKTCADYKGRGATGSLSCDATTCQIISTACVAPVINTCGNGQLDDGEECDVDSSNQLVFADGISCNAYHAGAQGTPLCESCHAVYVNACTWGGEGGVSTNNAVVEQCGTLTVTGSDTCSISGSGSTIVLRGTVLTPKKTYAGGGVVIKNGRISYVGCTPTMDNATVITCPGASISPGLINAHDHIGYSNAYPDNWDDERFDHRTDWRKNKNGHTNHNGDQTQNNEVGELRQLMSGTTAVFGSGTVKGLIRNIDTDGVGGVKTRYETFPIGKSGDTLNDQGNGNQEKSGCTKFAYLYANTGNYAPHIGEGLNDVAVNELRCFSGEGDGAKDTFDNQLSIIHAVAATPDIIQRMADADTKLIWSPRTNVSLYGDTAMAPIFDRMGVTIALGTDWIYSGSMNMLRELQCADYLNAYHYGKYFTDYDLWMMPTYNAAAVFGLTGFYGELKSGAIADIAIYRGKAGVNPHRAVIDAGPGDVLLVMMDGDILYGDANLVKGDNSEDVNVCDVAKKIRTKARATSKNQTYAQIDALKKYKLFYCDTPEKEPTCIPMRPRAKDTTDQKSTLYGAQSYSNLAASLSLGQYLEPEELFYSDPNDVDGDGIPNDKDNCPTVFNPVRPQYAPKTSDPYDEQSDMDGDGLGDMCDAYPLCAANDASCAMSNPKDWDGDGVGNTQDNCPNAANADQKDGDDDGLGDACDDCPDEAGPEGNGGCPVQTTPISVLRAAFIAGNMSEDIVATEGYVTAFEYNKRGFFMQTDDAGIYVYGSTAAQTVSVGDHVIVTGKQTNYYDMLELTNVTVVTADDTKSYDPIVVSATDVADSKSKYSGMLVRVNDVTATSEVDTFGVRKCTDSSGNAVYTDDFLMSTTDVTNAMTADKKYDLIGVVVYDYNKSKVASRSTADVIAK